MKKIYFLIIILFILKINVYSQKINPADLKGDLFIHTNPLKLLAGKIHIGADYYISNWWNIELSIAYKQKFNSYYEDYITMSPYRSTPYLMYYGLKLEPAVKFSFLSTKKSQLYCGLKTKLKFYWYKNGQYKGWNEFPIYTQNAYKTIFVSHFLLGIAKYNGKIYSNFFIGIGVRKEWEHIHITYSEPFEGGCKLE